MCIEKKFLLNLGLIGVDTWFESKVENNQENMACRTSQDGGQ